MGVKKDYIKDEIDAAALRGHDARIRDVAYALLRCRIDAKTAYMVVFGVPEKDNDVDDYESSAMVKYLRRRVDKSLRPESQEKDDDLTEILSLKTEKEKTDDGDITFEENKAAMIELIKRTEDALGAGEIDTDKGLKIIADLRVKLNDKFKVSDKEVQQYVIVQPKFNHICEHTRRECWLQTKKYAMEHWHLIEDPQYKD